MPRGLKTLTLIATLAATSSPLLAEEPLVIPGTGDAQALLREAARAYQLRYPGRKVVIPTSTGSFATKPNTKGGLESAGDETTELGRSAVPPRPIDIERFGPLHFREFARVPVVFVVKAGLGVKKLTQAQVCGIWDGSITNWKTVGGPDLAIVPQLRPEGSNMLTLRASLPCFEKIVPTKKGEYNLRNSDAVEAVRRTPGSLAFMPLWEARLHGFDTIELDGIAVDSTEYPASIPLGMVHKSRFLSAEAVSFLDFLGSEEGKKILVKNACTPVVGKSVLYDKDGPVASAPASGS
jgi:phosphate transport system substrate-binding protein